MALVADLPANLDVVVVGGGQAGLAVGYFLRRTGLTYVIVDGEEAPGGAWRHAWPSLRLFSPAQWSSLPGWLMPKTGEGFPTRDDVVAYLAAYEQRYSLPVRRPIRVTSVARAGAGMTVHSDRGTIHSRTVVSATGTWSAPHLPSYPGQARFGGTQVHSAHYEGPNPYAGRRILIVGGGNSGAQILAEVSKVAYTCWVTEAPPVFLPDDVDGRVLFERATLRWNARQAGLPDPTPRGGLGDIVMVPPVREARSRGALQSRRPFVEMTTQGVVWPDGGEEPFDGIIWCTGFRPALTHLQSLGIIEADGRIATAGTRAVSCSTLWLVGYGEWTGYASATLVGVMRSARATAAEIGQAISSDG